MTNSNLTTAMTTRTIYCTVPHKLTAASALVEWVRREVEHGHLGSGINQQGRRSWECPADMLQQVRDAAMLVQMVPTNSTTLQLLQVPHGTQAAMLVQEWLVDVLAMQLPLPCGYYGAKELAVHIEALLAE